MLYFKNYIAISHYPPSFPFQARGAYLYFKFKMVSLTVFASFIYKLYLCYLALHLMTHMAHPDKIPFMLDPHKQISLTPLI